MKLQRLTIQGVLAFKNVVIDWRELPAGLIAITGRNGAGKSTIMDATMASLYRAMPSRPKSIYDYAHGPASLIETEWEDCIARLELNAPQRTSKPFVLAVDRSPLTDGKAESFAEEIARRFPPLEVMLATAFASQDGRGSFRKLSRTGRKDLFVKLLGLHRYARLSELAGESQRYNSQAAEKLDSQGGVLQPEIDDLPTLRTAVTDRGEEVRVAKDRVRDLTAAIGERRRQTEELAAQRQDIEKVLEQHRAAIVAVNEAAQRLRRAQEAEKQAAERNLAAIRRHESRKQQLEEKLRYLEGLAGVAHPNAGEPVPIDEAKATAERAKAKHHRAVKDHQDSIQRQHDVADARLRHDVPCGAEGKYASCRFLERASAAHERVGELNTQEAFDLTQQLYEQERTAREDANRTEEQVRRAIRLQGEVELWEKEQATLADRIREAKTNLQLLNGEWVETCEAAQAEAVRLDKESTDAASEHAGRAAKVESLRDVGDRAKGIDEELRKRRAEMENWERGLEGDRAEEQRAVGALAAAEAAVERVTALIPEARRLLPAPRRQEGHRHRHGLPGRGVRPHGHPGAGDRRGRPACQRADQHAVARGVRRAVQRPARHPGPEGERRGAQGDVRSVRLGR